MKHPYSHKSILRMAAACMAVAILSGCSQTDDGESLEADSPLLIAADSSASRSATPLSGKYSDFGIWAWKDNAAGALSLVLGRQPSAVAGSEYYTRLEGTDWTYEYSDASVTQYIRYWDRGAANYYFTAYAPYKVLGSPLNETHTITGDKEGVSISGINIAEGIDWLEARWQRQVSPTFDIDLIAGEYHLAASFSAIVPLVFHHLLAVTEFRVYSDANITLSSISIAMDDADAIYKQADYEAGSWTNPGPKSTGIYSEAVTRDLSGTDKETSISLASLLQIPQSVTGRTIVVNATLSDSSKRSGTFTLTDGWAGEKKYIYYLCIKSGEIILMDFEAADWTDGGDITILDPVVNW